jgi:hypothetical protein
MESVAERRADPRVAYTGITIAKTEIKEFVCVGGNLSESGMLLYPWHALNTEVGTPMQLIFTLPMIEQRLEVEAVLLRHDLNTSRFAWGVIFSSVPQEARLTLAEFISTHLN